MNRTSSSRAVLALVLAAGLCSLGAAQAATAPAAPASAASAPANTLRPEVSKPLLAVQDKLRAQAWAEALDLLKAAQALPGITPYEQYVMTRMRAQASYGAGDVPTALADFETTYTSPLTPAAERRPIGEALIKIAYQAKDYPRAIRALKSYIADGGSDADLKALLPQALYLSEDFAGAADAMKAGIDAEYAAGKTPSEKTLRLLASAQNRAKDDAGYLGTVERLAVAYPQPDYWADVFSRAASADGQAERLQLDVYRLGFAIQGHKKPAQRLQHAYLAVRAGYPAEAKQLIEDGLGKKVFVDKELAEANKTLAQANRLINQDRAAAAANETSARSAKDGDALVGLGLELVLDGQGDKGLALIEAGLAKPTFKLADDARLHQGYALFRLGRFAEARKVFDTVQGKDGTQALARAWSLFSQIDGKIPAPAAN